MEMGETILVLRSSRPSAAGLSGRPSTSRGVNDTPIELGCDGDILLGCLGFACILGKICWRETHFRGFYPLLSYLFTYSFCRDCDTLSRWLQSAGLCLDRSSRGFDVHFRFVSTRLETISQRRSEREPG